MTGRRVALVVLGSGLLTSWLVVAGTMSQRPQGLTPVPSPSAIDSTPSGLPIQTERLRQRQAQTPAPRPEGRNPFVFAARAAAEEPVPSADRAFASREATLAPPEPVVPAIGLVAIATEGDQRTAVLSVAGDIVFAHPGDTIAGRYRVEAVTAEVVVLEDLLGGPRLRVPLR